MSDDVDNNEIYDIGFFDGKNDGFDEGFHKGHNEGYSNGYEDGKQETENILYEEYDQKIATLNSYILNKDEEIYELLINIQELRKANEELQRIIKKNN